jgi:hypothetical protein
LWKQGAEENRTQPIVVRLAGREREMDRQAIGVHHRVNLAPLSAEKRTWPYLLPAWELVRE